MGAGEQKTGPGHRLAPGNWVSPTAIDSQERGSDALSTALENRTSSNLRGDGDVLHWRSASLRVRVRRRC